MTEVTVSLPDHLLERIDAEVEQHPTVSRSDLLALAVQRELDRREAMDAAIARARERFRDVGPVDFTALVRAERDRDERADW
jgi:Arc/MetJ-type ribon-helix-helix transcriptional regulator